jgi:hypothetical protein
VLREVLELDRRSRGAGKALAAARRAAECIAEPRPAEVGADLRIRVASAAMAAGKPGLPFASEQLAAVDVGRGPCAPHLAARRAAAAAAIAAHSGKVEVYEAEAEAAIRGMSELGDRAALLALLHQVGEVPIEAGRSAVRDRLASRLAALRRDGAPGGDGASSTMGGLGELPADAGEHTVVFTVRYLTEPAALELTDRFGGQSQRHELRWKPCNVNWNGCGIGLHGGYFVVRSLQYGTNGASGGALGQGTLEQLGNYLPLTGDGHWELCNNGAVRFLRGS